ncbi:hypothetical protein [Pseudomonas sp. NPDC086278]|uniref:hypothetical protein n=1 Tax=Pseudomonas sp. NPDC086278 TaxID=3390646 RepID=UPI003CFCFD6A
MSSVKDYFFEVEQERCLVWIKETYGIDIDPDEPSEEWDSLASEYQAMLDAESEEAEARWLERHSYNEFFFEFSEELTTASSLLSLKGDSYQTSTLCRLVYAQAVTLLETLISSVIRKLVVSDQSLMLKLAAKHENLHKRTITLKEIAEQPKVVEAIVLKVLSELSFHNIATIKEVLGAMFGDHMKGLDLGGIGRICAKRHDIVHRNGKTVQDEPVVLTPVEVREAITTIRAFAADLKVRIYDAINDLSSTAP